AQLKLLKFVDYLSTVSGGGYVGAWLSAWIKRGADVSKSKKGLEAVEKKLAPDPSQGKSPAREAEAPPVKHLRCYSNYLAPRGGFLSADGWVLWASYLRNFLLNQLVLLPACVLILLIPRLFMWLFFPWSSLQATSWSNESLPDRESIMIMFGVAYGIGVLLLFVFAQFIQGAANVWPARAGAPAKNTCRLGASGMLILVL